MIKVKFKCSYTVQIRTTKSVAEPVFWYVGSFPMISEIGIATESKRPEDFTVEIRSEVTLEFDSE